MTELTIAPMANVTIPSSRNSQNHPGLPFIPRISRIPAARRAEMTRAILTWVVSFAILEHELQ